VASGSSRSKPQTAPVRKCSGWYQTMRGAASRSARIFSLSGLVADPFGRMPTSISGGWKDSSTNGDCRTLEHLRTPRVVVKYGRRLHETSLPIALLAWDRRVVSVLLERGADVVTDYPFARAFQMRIRTALGCYLDCRRQRPDLADALQQQADMALRQACSDKNLKWVSLLLWVGADPRAKGLAVDDVNDPEAQRSALQEACISGHLEIVKRLKPIRRAMTSVNCCVRHRPLPSGT
jgi:hypothetical protein